MDEQNKEHPRLKTALVIVANVVLIVSTLLVFLIYNNDNRKKMAQQNLNDITNINESSAKISSSYFLTSKKRLDDSVKYITEQNLTHDQTLDYMRLSDSDEKSTFELVGTDYKGFATILDGTSYTAVSYTSGDYATIQAIFAAAGTSTATGLLCTPEFTDYNTGFNSFALYAYLTLDNGGTATPYTLMEVTKSSSISSNISLDGGYSGIATTLVNSSGDYLFGNSAFKSTNLFVYFYKYNSLTYDQRTDLATAFSKSDSGTYYYKNSKNQDCVFVYCKVPSTSYYSITVVPLSSYTVANLDVRYTLLTVSILAALMIFDLIMLYRSNRKLKISNEKEKEASEAKTDFLSRMSHDIRTPLNVIIGTTILAQKEDNPPATQKYLVNIDRSGKMLLGLINDILDLNKVESGKMELHPSPYSFKDFTISMESIIGPLCHDKKIDFKIEGDDEYPVLLFDSVRLNQIFYNLLSNSVKFTPEGGHITLKVNVTTMTSGKARADFIVRDDGIGMSPEFQKHMFEVFTQEERKENKGNTQGTGLGLAIVKNLVELMGGTISVESELEKGTKFYVSLISEITSAPEINEQNAHNISDQILKDKKILLCEDNDLNAEIAEKILEGKGITCTRAVNGQEGIDKFLDSEINYYDAILMDMRMPVMDGIAATKAIRALDRKDAKSIPIIAMTANAYDTDVKNCIDAGMNAHLSKPIEPKVVFKTLADQIDNAEKKR
jgi:signal transduction histidine kinase/CheY-like chemotaxis protein